MPDTPKIEKRAVVEYRETPFDGKARVVNNIVTATDPDDLDAKFWSNPTWAGRRIKKVERLNVQWLD